MSATTARKTLGQIEFDSPANRIIAQQAPKNQFGLQLLPDIAFLRQLAVQGRMRYFEGTTVGAGSAISIVPANGETLFIYKIIVGANTTLAHTIANDGITRAIIVTNVNAVNTFQLDIFDSLVGDGIKAFTVTTAGSARATAFGWVENTARIRDVTT